MSDRLRRAEELLREAERVLDAVGVAYGLTGACVWATRIRTFLDENQEPHPIPGTLADVFTVREDPNMPPDQVRLDTPDGSVLLKNIGTVDEPEG